MEWMLLLKGILIAWFLAFFEPYQEYIVEPIKKYIPLKFWYLRKALSCFKCLSLYITLIVSHSFFCAILASLIAYTYQKIIDSLPTQV